MGIGIIATGVNQCDSFAIDSVEVFLVHEGLHCKVMRFNDYNEG